MGKYLRFDGTNSQGVHMSGTGKEDGGDSIHINKRFQGEIERLTLMRVAGIDGL